MGGLGLILVVFWDKEASWLGDILLTEKGIVGLTGIENKLISIQSKGFHFLKRLFSHVTFLRAFVSFSSKNVMRN